MPRGKCLECVTIREDEPGDLGRLLGSHELADGAARIITDQRYIVQVELIKQIDNEVCHPTRTDIRGGG